VRNVSEKRPWGFGALTGSGATDVQTFSITAGRPILFVFMRSRNCNFRCQRCSYTHGTATVEC